MIIKTNLEYFKAFNESVELENVTFKEINESGNKDYRCRVSKVIHSLQYKPGRTKPPYIGKIVDLDAHWIEGFK